MKFLLIGLCLMSSLTAMARSSLSPQDLERLAELNLTGKLRVHLSGKLTSGWERESLENINISNGDLSSVTREETLKVVVRKSTKGLITGVSSEKMFMFLSILIASL